MNEQKLNEEKTTGVKLRWRKPKEARFDKGVDEDGYTYYEAEACYLYLASPFVFIFGEGRKELDELIAVEGREARFEFFVNKIESEMERTGCTDKNYSTFYEFYPELWKNYSSLQPLRDALQIYNGKPPIKEK